jgi:CRISPR-associated exonuclease Cas4
LWSSRRLREATGLPAGKLIYSDTGAREEVEEPLYCRRYGLVGRPDYLVRFNEQGREVVVPVEVKSSRLPQTQHPGHALQVGAYCLMVEETYGVAPPYGLIRYSDGTMPVPFTVELRRAVLHAADEIRRSRTSSQVNRQHNTAERCVRCGYRYACGQQL